MRHNKYYRGKLTKREKSIKVKKTLSFILTMVMVFTGYYNWAMYQPEYAIADVNVKPRLEYKYNEQIPVDVVRAEIRTQASRYGVSIECMDRIVFCESGYDNLAKNPNSTGLGLSQYLIGTWQETNSFKERKARTDYKASLKEMALDIANGEIWRWNDSYSCWNMACINN